MEKKFDGLIIVMLVLVLSLGGFIINDKFINPTKCPKTQNTAQTCDSKDTVKEEDAYAKFLKGLKNESEAKEVLVPYDQYGENPISSVIITKENKAYVTFNDKVISDAKMSKFTDTYKKSLTDLNCEQLGGCSKGYYLGMDNVVKAYVVKMGQGGHYYITLLTSAGEVYAINSSKLHSGATSSIEVYKVESLKNIVSIESWATSSIVMAFATDIDGVINALSDELK